MRRADPVAALEDALKRWGVKPEAGVLIACSGGPDSSALVLAASRTHLEPRFVSIAHFDHGIRPEVERVGERTFVRALAERLGFAAFYGESPPGGFAMRPEGVEAAARHARYAFLAETAARVGASIVLTAHTLDDQRETVLARALSGSGPEGLKGIPERRGIYGRPFLSLTKADILAWLDALGEGFVLDSSNASSAYQRNKVRNELIPALGRVFPGWGRGLDTLAKRSAMVARFLRTSLEARFSWDARFAGGAREGGARWLRAPAASFFALDPALKLEALYAGAGLLGVTRVPFAMLEAPCRNEASGVRGLLAASKDLSIERKGTVLFLSRPSPSDSRSLAAEGENGYFYEVPGPGSLPMRLGDHFVAEWIEEGPGLAEGSFAFPLVVRSSAKGDRIGMARGKKCLAKLYGEWGVPAFLRLELPVLEDARGIAAVLGSCFGFKDRYAERGSSVAGARRLSIRPVRAPRPGTPMND